MFKTISKSILILIVISSGIAFADTIARIGRTEIEAAFNKILRSDYKTVYEARLYDYTTGPTDLTLISDCSTNRVGIKKISKIISNKEQIDKSNWYIEKMQPAVKTSPIGIIHTYACRFQNGPRLTSSRVINGEGVNWEPYLKELEAGLYMEPQKLSLTYPQIPDQKPMVILYRITRDGIIIAAKLLKSGGNNYLYEDRIATEERINVKVNPLPNTYKKSFVDIEFHYDYSVDSSYIHPELNGVDE